MASFETGFTSNSSPLGGAPSRAADDVNETTTDDQEVETPAEQKIEQEQMALADYLKNIWTQNYRHKITTGVQERMLSNLRMRDNQYDPDQLQALREAGSSDIFMGLTGVKTGHAEAWLHDIFSSSEKTWGLKPTPIPNMDPGAMSLAMRVAVEKLKAQLQTGEQGVTASDLESALRQFQPLADQAMLDIAEERARKMETKIADQMAEGGWDEAFEDFLSDLITLKCGILKGPIIRRKTKMEWKETTPGNFIEVETEELVPEFTTVSPLDFYPSPASANVQKGNMCERIKFTRKDLVELKGEEGYVDENIDEALKLFTTVTKVVQDAPEADRNYLEQKQIVETAIQLRETVDGVEHWCSVQGSMLKEYGMKTDLKGNDLEDLAEYDANVIVVNEKVIYVDLNKDPMKERPYSVWGWKKVPGSFWFKGVPELMIDLQRVCNAAARSLVNNMALASGPQCEIDTSRIPAGEDLENIYALKIWQTISKGGNVNIPAIRFFQPDSRANELIGVYEKFAQMADDYTGIPAYAFGSDKVAGAGRTSSGLSMLMTASARGIKRVILGIDRHVIKTVVRRMFNYNMQYDTDPSIKGDMDIVTTGAVGLMIKEQLSERRMTFLAQTNNPVDLELMGREGRAKMLREAASALETDSKSVVKSEEEIKRLEIQKDQEMRQAQQSQAQAGQAQAQQIQQSTQMQQQQMELAKQKQYADMQLKVATLELKKQELAQKAQIAGHDMDIKRVTAEAASVNAQLDAATKGLALLTQSMQADEGKPNEEAGPGNAGNAQASESAPVRNAPSRVVRAVSQR